MVRLERSALESCFDIEVFHGAKMFMYLLFIYVNILIVTASVIKSAGLNIINI